MTSKSDQIILTDGLGLPHFAILEKRSLVHCNSGIKRSVTARAQYPPETFGAAARMEDRFLVSGVGYLMLWLNVMPFTKN
jgi:hypothetical protein